jgi:hypothetical protein
MPSKSQAQTLLEKADEKATSSTGWSGPASTKWEEAGDLFQQAANQFKINRQFREAGDAFAREAECREKGKELIDAANSWWNAAMASLWDQKGMARIQELNGRVQGIHGRYGFHNEWHAIHFQPYGCHSGPFTGTCRCRGVLVQSQH